MVSDQELLAYRDRLLSATKLELVDKDPAFGIRWAESYASSGNTADFQVSYRLSTGSKLLTVFLRRDRNRQGKDGIVTSFGGSPFHSRGSSATSVVSLRNAKGEFPAFGAIRRLQNELNAKERERLIWNESNREGIEGKKRLDGIFANLDGEWKTSHNYQHQAEKGKFCITLSERTQNSRLKEYGYNLSLSCRHELSPEEAIRLVKFLSNLSPVEEG